MWFNFRLLTVAHRSTFMEFPGVTGWRSAAVTTLKMQDRFQSLGLYWPGFAGIRIRYFQIGCSTAVGVITERRLNPVVNIVRYFELKVLVENGSMSNTVECFGKVQNINNDVRICVEESGDDVEELY